MSEIGSDRERLADMLSIAEDHRAEIVRQIEPGDRFIYTVWGVAWLVGFVVLWLTSGDDPRIDAATASGLLFTALIITAIVVNIVHVARRVRGVHGPTATVGQRYSAAWAVAFATFGAVLAGLGRADVGDDVLDLVAPLLACFIVALLYLAGGALWDDRPQFGAGVWIAVCVGAGALLGAPSHLLVLGVGGGGGLLVAAFLSHRRLATTNG